MLSPYLMSGRGPGAYAGGEGDPGIPEPPIVTDIDGDVTINGKVKPGSFGKFVYPLATIAANRRYTFRVVANFAQLTRQGDLAMVGFGLKNGNDFHITGLRGDGAGGTKEYIVHGTNPNGWNKQTGHTEVDGGAAAAGTQHSAYYRLTTSSDGTTYTLETDTDGTSYSTVFTGQSPTPFTNVSQATSFGVALWFNNLDTGPFSIQVTEFVDEAAITDPYIANVVLLINPTGADGSQVITDASPAAHGTASVTGAVVDTDITDGGNPTLLFDGTNDTVSFTDSDDWRLSAANSDQFAIEVRIRFSALGANVIMVGQRGNSGTFAWGFQTGSPSDEFKFASSDNGTAFNNDPLTTSANLTTGVWYDLAANKDSSGKIRMFKDGVMVGSTTPASSVIFNSTSPLTIGTSATAANDLAASISRIRITKGSDRGWNDSGYTPQAPGHFPTS